MSKINNFNLVRNNFRWKTIQSKNMKTFCTSLKSILVLSKWKLFYELLVLQNHIGSMWLKHSHNETKNNNLYLKYHTHEAAVLKRGLIIVSYTLFIHSIKIVKINLNTSKNIYGYWKSHSPLLSHEMNTQVICSMSLFEY